MSQRKTIQIYLIDDQAMIRAAIRTLLERRPEFEVVGENGDARRALAEISKLLPDVVLLDITMEGLSGLDAIGPIREIAPKTRLVMLTNHEGRTFVEQAFKAGASGYLSKDSDESELALAIESVFRGRTYVSPKVSNPLVAQLRDPLPGAPAAAGTLETLTRREREVFQLLALGKCNKEVAKELGMSLGTAKKHRENLQRKLDCHSTAELARLAIREGLLTT